jgi:D-alanine-D-alanine ligase-like ATP-grasp enzyme
MALTALLDGVGVKFFRSQQEARVKIPTFASEYKSPVFCELSVGKTSRYFVASQSDKLNAKAAANSRDKLLTKQILHRHGLNSPFGGGAAAGKLLTIQEMINAGVPRVVVKPIVGSLAKGVVLNLSPRAAADYISGNPSEKFVVEQQIIGREYRVYVAGNRVLGAFTRLPQHVIGDGLSTIQVLFQAKADGRLLNPRFNGRAVDFALAELALLRRRDRMDRIPAKGEIVGLATDALSNDAGDRVYASDTLPPAAAELCVAAVKAMGLVAGGVDVMVDQHGVPYILELNIRAMIALHSFPYPIGPWNLEVPRGILRHFLPASKVASKIVTSFDFAALEVELLREGRSDRGVNAADFATFG